LQARLALNKRGIDVHYLPVICPRTFRGCIRRHTPAFLAFLVLLAAGLCAGQACGENITSAGGGFWDVAATWTPSQVPANTDNVTIAGGCTVTNRDLATRHAGNLTIQSGGVLTHTSNTTAEAYKIILNVASNLTIEPGGQINVNGRGYSTGNGPGKPSGAYAGGSYGGLGGRHKSYGPPGPTYGSITAPTNLGSGGYNIAAAGAAGGGAVILNVSGATTLNGEILARSGHVAGGYDGSGGTVFLTTGTLAGSGTISASTTNGATGPGGGGRIAVVLTNSTSIDNVRMTAYSSINNSDHKNGAGGTVYLERQGDFSGRGQLVVDYNDILPGDRLTCFTLQCGTGVSSYAFSEIVLTNGGVYGLDTNDTLDITATTIRGDPSDRNDGIYVIGGTLSVPAAFTWTGVFIAIGATNTTFNPTASLTVGTNAALRMDVPWTMNYPVTVAPGGIMDHSQNSTNEAYKLNLTINGTLDIQAGGAIDVDGMGYAWGNGIGKAGLNSGAGYGGMGGHHNTAGTFPGTTDGSITAPTNIGSGGYIAGNGGGAVILTVNDTITLNGMILARPNLAGYQGSGGTVFLTTGTLTGNGTINAGALAGATSSGGGGRVSVILTNGNDFGNVTMLATSAMASHRPGSPGTVYTQTRDQGPGGGTLVINATNIVAAAVSSTLISSNVTDCLVGTVVITNKAKFQIDTNQSLTVNGSWTNKAVFIANTNSTLILGSTNTAAVYGSNAFYNLTCTNAGKTIMFTAGTTNFVNGKLLMGAGVTLKSTSGDAWWYLNLAPGGTQQVGAVSVRDSNADGGQKIIANKGSFDLGNNRNWVFLKYQGTVFRFR